MTTQEPRTGVQVEPLSEEEEREFRGEIEALRRPDYDSFKGRVGRLLATLDATRDEIAAAYRAGRESARRRRPIDRDALARALYAVSQRHDWEHTTDREDRTEEIAAEYDAMTLDGSPLASKSGSETVPAPWSVETVAAALAADESLTLLEDETGDGMSPEWFEALATRLLAAETVPVVREGLDEAWAAAEAALPEGWRWAGLYRRGRDGTWIARGYHPDAPQPYGPPVPGKNALGTGPTPTTALQALAARLNEDARHGK